MASLEKRQGTAASAPLLPSLRLVRQEKGVARHTPPALSQAEHFPWLGEEERISGDHSSSFPLLDWSEMGRKQ